MGVYALLNFALTSNHQNGAIDEDAQKMLKALCSDFMANKGLAVTDYQVSWAKDTGVSPDHEVGVCIFLFVSIMLGLFAFFLSFALSFFLSFSFLSLFF